MSLDVVRVTVEAIGVVSDDDIRAVPVHQPGETAGSLLDRSSPECPGCGVTGPAHHPGVAVAEQLQVADAQGAAASFELSPAQRYHCFRVMSRLPGLDPAWPVSGPAVGAGHEHGADALG